jgi:hypothetical protein
MNKTVARGQVSRLDLVYPPISNQEAVWLESDPDVQNELRASNLYIIAARPEAKFTDIRINEEEHTAQFNVRVGDHLCEPALLRFPAIPGIEGHDGYWLEDHRVLF